MLISVYNNSANANDFQQDFNENIILPPNSTIKMLKAFIPINKTITTTQAYNIFFTIGGQNTSPYNVVLPQGTYGLSSMALTINDLISNKIVSLNLPASFKMTHNDNLGVEAGAYSYTLANLTFTPNLTTLINWNDGSTPTVDWKTTTVIDTTTFYKNYFSLGTSTLLNNVGVPVNSWAYIGHFDKYPIEKSMYKNTNDATGVIPPISSNTADYGALWWSNRYGGNAGATDATYCVSLCSNTPDMTAISANNIISQFRNQKGIYAMAVVCGQPINAGGVLASKGDLLIWEDNGSGNLASVGRFEAGIGANDKIAIVIPDDNSPLEYWVNFNGSGIWREIGGLTGTRYDNPDTDDLYMGFTAYNAMPYINPNVANITQINGSFDFLGDYENWGTYTALNWGGLHTQLGYTNQSDNETTTFPTLSVLTTENEAPIQLDTTTTEKARMPFINVNINELPIQNYSINDPNSLGLSTSRTVCSISRYNDMGDYSADKNDAMIFDNNTQICPLNNAHEISISQLTFSLRNADGTLPSDLGTPQGFILDVQPQVI